MADNKIQVPENDRTVRLSEVDFSPRNYVDANVSVPARGWMAKTSRNGGKLVSQTGVAQGTGAAPTHLRVVRSERNPGEFVLVPTNEESTDHIAVQWIDQGRFAKFHFGKLLALKQMQIPKGTRMVAALFPEKDSTYGNVVGIILNEVEFVAVESKAKAKPATDTKAEQEPHAPA